MLPAAAAHAFVDDLDAPQLTSDDEHHLFRVLRLRPGEEVTLSDGRGRWRAGIVRDGRRGIEPSTDVVVEPPPSTVITIAFAVPKGERPEWIVQKLTEVGVDRMVPLATQHSVVKWDADRSARAVARLREIARGAAMQCRRVWLPQVDEVRAVGDMLADAAGEIAMAEPGGAPPDLSRPTVLVGPEGGWSAEEVAGAPATVGLGPTILRTETAALAAAVRLCALRDG